MAAGHHLSSSTTQDALTAEALQAWLKPLQQALQLEADRGFGDLKGRQERFSGFVARTLAQPLEGFSQSERQGLAGLAQALASYGDLSLARRQNLVRQCRERLHQLRQAHQPAIPVGPPRLKLVASAVPSPPSDSGASSSHWDPDTPLGEIKGVGPKTATRLAQLGLFVLRDLVHYYPRDYLDYANLVRITGLEPGRTATIVATVRRSHAFTSPRNPNLSILELHLADITGKIRVSRFFAGKRFASPGWLKGQQAHFPPGATVAVSGLVKETPFGPAFQDPLMEVLEHSHAQVRSESIGRLIPVYGLTEGLGSERLRQALAAVLPEVRRWGDPLPETLRLTEGLIPRPQALVHIHQPSNQQELQASRHRLVFDEFLLLQLGLLQRRRQLSQRPAPPPGARGRS